MFSVNSENLPKLIVNDLAYLLHYSIYGFIISFFIIVPFLQKYLDGFTINSDYEMFGISIILGLFMGFIYKIFSTPIDRRLIKRNIFVAGLIKILRKRENLRFQEISDNYSYLLFQNKKVISGKSDLEDCLEALIAIDIIELKNYKQLKKKDEVYDYKIFSKNLDNSIFVLKDKNVNVDELIKRLDNYVL